MQMTLKRLVKVLFIAAVIGFPIWLLGERLWLQRTDGYRLAVAHLQQHPGLLDDIGSPIEVRLGLLAGYFEISPGGSKRCVMDFSVRGPRGAGAVEVHLVRSGTGWQIRHAFYTPSGGGKETEITRDDQIIKIIH
jgi:hypothetical protein